MTIIYGLLLMSMIYTATAFSLSELAARYPTAGGQYHWTSILAPPELSRGMVSAFEAMKLETESCLELRVWLGECCWETYHLCQCYYYCSKVLAWYRCLPHRFLCREGLAYRRSIPSDKCDCAIVRHICTSAGTFYS